MGVLALPPHLRNKKHNDWIWPLSLISRGSNARGPREDLISKDYLPWPPKLIEGRGVCRWETAGAHSILYIPALENETLSLLSGYHVYGRSWMCVETNPGNPDFMKTKEVYFPFPIVPARVWDLQNDDGSFTMRCEPNVYSPSAIQYFSKSGYMRLYPDYYSTWSAFDFKITDGIKKWSRGFFYRWGWRPDHLDVYYNWGPFVGLRGE